MLTTSNDNNQMIRSRKKKNRMTKDWFEYSDLSIVGLIELNRVITY